MIPTPERVVVDLPIITTREVPTGTVVLLLGEHDVATAGQVLSEIESLTPRGDIVVDLNGATFIDSSVLRALVRGWKSASAAGRQFQICISEDHALRRVLSIAGLDTALPVITEV